MQQYFDNILCRYQCGFRGGDDSHHRFITIIEKWRECENKDRAFGALLGDLSKTFECLPHELLIVNT